VTYKFNGSIIWCNYVYQVMEDPNQTGEQAINFTGDIGVVWYVLQRNITLL
jgi:hypothetical protein